MPSTKPIGDLASSLVFATFRLRLMLVVRALALAGNVAFVSYAYLGRLAPVLMLHALLLPMNAYRLAEIVLTRPPAP
jgi:CRP/FNR family transcriptional regulator, cyclic AMP receptor protein